MSVCRDVSQFIMDRFPGVFCVFLTATVHFVLSLPPLVPFEIDVTKYKLPDSLYPENDRDAIPVDMLQDLDVTKFKLLEGLFPENDRDAIPFRRNLIPDLEKKGIVIQDDLAAPKTPNYAYKTFLDTSDWDADVVKFYLTSLHSTENKDNVRETSPLFLDQLREAKVEAERQKRTEELKRRIVKDLKLLKMLEGNKRMKKNLDNTEVFPELL